MRLALLVALVLASTLAGCASSGADDPAAEPTREARQSSEGKPEREFREFFQAPLAYAGQAQTLAVEVPVNVTSVVFVVAATPTVFADLMVDLGGCGSYAGPLPTYGQAIGGKLCQVPTPGPQTLAMSGLGAAVGTVHLFGSFPLE